MSRLLKTAPVAGAWAAVLVIGGYAVFAWQLIGGSKTWWPDFIGYYTAARIVWSGQGSRLYDLGLQNQIQSQLSGVPVDKLLPLPYDSPPHFAVLMAPFAAVPYETAYLAWVCLTLVLFVVGLVLLCRELGFRGRSLLLATLGSLTFFPVFVTVVRGQLDGVVFICLVAAFIAWRRAREAAGGAAVGLGLAKFHVLFAMPLLYLGRASWRALAGLAAVGAAAVVLATAVLGAGTWAGWLRLLLPAASGQSEGFAHGRAISYSLSGLAAAVGLPSSVGLAAAALLLLGYLVYAMGRGRDREVLFAAAIPISVVASPHQGLQDLSLLLLPALFLVQRRLRGELPAPAVPLALFAGVYALSFISAGGAAGWAIALLTLGFAVYLGWLGAGPARPVTALGRQPAMAGP